ncbi:hypothetical protein [Taklimakanibacter deserti]|jgi:hypothetical protein|uniref:hypothetical protein n=1 Tax=Taklimakanibacter deserti TaxID=2267839 RepID=UPI000E651875
MTLTAHKALFSLIVLAALVGFGWILIIYVLSFHGAQWVIDRLEDGYAPRRRPQLRPAPVRPQRRSAPYRISRA